ncbi:hypothetical protein EVAR_35863_1 [Eumeta japonica]|uniref:Uncharacterized protein n=1 Tax=Eumeta variegata TaxID=151549 RepID=A0A4C1WZW1_EUMVA|nr:hypothetical protein EVAR_35863_1 [Eumeta japonica]
MCIDNHFLPEQCKNKPANTDEKQTAAVHLLKLRLPRSIYFASRCSDFKPTVLVLAARMLLTTHQYDDVIGLVLIPDTFRSEVTQPLGQRYAEHPFSISIYLYCYFPITTMKLMKFYPYNILNDL